MKIKKIIVTSFLSLSLLIGLTSLSNAQIESSGLPIPRFVSLKSAQVNLRSGPGVRYPVIWVYLSKALPVEIIGEYDNWRKIRDWEGSEGWVHKSLLSGKRMVRITGIQRTLYRNSSEPLRIMAKVESGVIGELNECPKDSLFCKVSFGNISGWMKRSDFWGVYPPEYFD